MYELDHSPLPTHTLYAPCWGQLLEGRGADNVQRDHVLTVQKLQSKE